MRTLLISYTTLVAFIVMSLVIAVGFAKPNQAATQTEQLNNFVWVFDYKTNGEVVNDLNTGSPVNVNLGVGFNVNTEDYGNAYTPISAVKVIDPYVTGENDLQVGMGKAIILADTSNNVNDTYKGGDFVFTVNSGSLRKVEFDLIDAMDEIDTNIGGTRPMNHHYLKVYFKDGTTSTIGLDNHDGSNMPDKYIRHVDTMVYNKDISKFVVHINGSASLDNLKVFSPVTPTVTPTPTTRPTANFNTVCTAGQTYGNLSYTMSLTSIKPADKFEKNEWYMCMNPKTNTDHAYVYTNYFGSKATHKAATNSASELPAWACYRIGNVNTYLRPGNDYINYNFDQNNDLDYGNGSLKKDINDMARWIDGEGQAGRMNKNATFRTKVNLWAGGGFNDQIAAPVGIKINSSACVQPSVTPTVTATVTPTTRPSSTPTLTPTVKPLVCTAWKTENLISGEFNASKANARSFDLGTLTFNSVAKKYPVTLAAKWGWTGAEGTNNQFGNAFSPKVQNNEEHNVNIRFIDAQSAATKTMSTFCGDLGNTVSYDDGINLLDIDTPSTELDKFKLCRKNIAPEANDGVASSLMTLNLENKYDSVKISSVLDYTQEEYNECVEKYSARKCNQSHYSMVQVTYCTKEG